MVRVARFAAVTAALVGLVAISQPAGAGTVTCPGTAATTDREFQVTVGSGDPACLFTGTGNFATPANPTDPFLEANPGWSFVDWDGSNNAGDFGFSYTGDETLIGTFALTPEAGFKYALGLRSRNETLNPDWVVVELPLGTTGGAWAIASGEQVLSSANLYKMAVSEIPLPASLPLLLAGVAGLGFIGRRRFAA
jgi:hypothetical protein